MNAPSPLAASFSSAGGSSSDLPDLPSEWRSDSTETHDARESAERESRPPVKLLSSSISFRLPRDDVASRSMRPLLITATIVARSERSGLRPFPLSVSGPGCSTQHAIGATSSEHSASTAQSILHPYATSSGAKSSGSRRPASE